MTVYSECDQCMRHCPVERLRCEIGRKRYFEVTGKEYEPVCGNDTEKRDAYRRKIREMRARRNKQT